MLAMTKNNEKDAVARIEKEAAERRLFRKLEQRNRLMGLAEREVAPKRLEQRKIEALKSYIDQWATWMQRDRSGLELPHSAPFVEQGRSWEHSILDPLDCPNVWAIKIVEAAMNELACHPEGMRMRHAIRVRWLNEHLDAKVFRSSRLHGWETDDLADAGEVALIPLVERRGLPLE